jgi:hypothetical protein
MLPGSMVVNGTCSTIDLSVPASSLQAEVEFFQKNRPPLLKCETPPPIAGAIDIFDPENS